MVKRGLGSGLSALINSNIDDDFDINNSAAKQSTNSNTQTKQTQETVDTVDNSKEKIHMISITNIYPNADQPRKVFDEEKLTELSNSIKENGVIQPIIVQKEDKGYMIVAGERRYRASKEAGLTEMPCIIKNYEKDTLLKISLLENIQREDLNPIEEAETYDKILKAFNITQDNLAKELGKSRTYVTNSLRLLKLSPKIKEYIMNGKIPYTSARALITLNESEQEEMAKKILGEGLNTREVENSKNKKKITFQPLSVEYKQIENQIKDFFGTKVKLHHGEKQGKIEITYFGNDDLERILNLLER